MSDFTLGKEIFEFNKSPFPAGNADKIGNYPFYCSSREPKTSPFWLLDTTAILMGTGGIASVHLGKGKFSFSTDTWAFRSNTDEIETEYLYWKLALIIEKINYSGFEGTGLKHLRKKYIRNLVMSFPDTFIQKKICQILGFIDISINKTDEIIKKYKQIKSGLMHDLFTRGVLPDGKLRPPLEQAPELYKETKIGWIPKEWEIGYLSEKAVSGIQHLRTGPFGSSLKSEHWVVEGHPVITIGALGEGFFAESELLYVSDLTALRLSAYKLKVGDIVFSRVADVGRSAVIADREKDWIMSSNLMRISIDHNKVLPEFLQQQIAFDYNIKKQIRMKVNSGGRDVANSNVLNDLIFKWPEPEEQKLIIKSFKLIDQKIFSEQDLFSKLHNKKLGLMNDLLTGKVEVKITSEELESA